MLPDQEDKKKRALSSGEQKAFKRAKSEPAKSVLGDRDTLTDLFSVPAIASTIKGHLPLKAKVQLSGVNKYMHNHLHHDLYDSHAETLPYKTRASAVKKTDNEEAEQMFEEVRKAVNLAYQMLIDYLTGHELNPSHYGISGKRWKDFLNKLSSYKDNIADGMHPSTAAGYIVEDITTHILTKWAEKNSEKGAYNFQDTDVMGGVSRPDITAETKHDQKVLMDITATKSRGHILDKDGDWLSFPHVAELLYPTIDFDSPGAISMKLTPEEKAEILRKAIQKQIEQEASKYENYLDARAKYYRDVKANINNLLKNPSSRRLKIFMEANPHVRVIVDGDKFFIEIDSYSSLEGSLTFDPWENVPSSPPHYSMSSDEDLTNVVKKTKYPTTQEHKAIVAKKHNNK